MSDAAPILFNPVAAAGTLLAGGSSLLQISESRKARKQAQRLADQQEQKQLQLEGELKARTEADKKAKARNALRARAGAVASAFSSRANRDTLFTSPLGLTSLFSSGQKSILGS